MEKLIKPAEYAKKVGISRQAVYAKIKKGILPSRNLNGKIYIVDNGSGKKEEKENGRAAEKLYAQRSSSAPVRDMQELLRAKEETISVLKETIRDMKETNHMITSTLRSEVELLKEAFGEMKTLYAAQIEHIKKEREGEEEEAEDADDIVTVEEEAETVPAKDKKGKPRWMSVPAWLFRNGIEKKKEVQKIRKKIKKLSKEKDPRVKKENSEYYIKVFSGLEKDILGSGGK